MAKKAFAREDKDDRRRLILATAAQLFLERDGTLPSAARIAAACGLAKGTVYIYFTTKGAIFAALQADGWRGLRDAVDRVTGTATGTREAMVAAIIAGLVDHLRHHPELLRLDALGHGVIEPNMAAGELAAFKAEQMAMLTVSADDLDRVLALPTGKGLKMLLRSYALIRGMWQSLPSSDATDAAFDFYVEVTEALHEYWRGALARP
jgi:AcrR family transcriptional regulator